MPAATKPKRREPTTTTTTTTTRLGTGSGSYKRNEAHTRRKKNNTMIYQYYFNRLNKSALMNWNLFVKDMWCKNMDLLFELSQQHKYLARARENDTRYQMVEQKEKPKRTEVSQAIIEFNNPKN